MIAIIDYGMGNLRSVEKACLFAGHDAVVTSDASAIQNASHIILPGVGAAKDAMERLKTSNLQQVIVEEVKKGKPFLGICLGMQLLFEKSFEYGECDCFNLIAGKVARFSEQGLRIPHIGWNELIMKEDDPIVSGGYVYFVHSYHAVEVPACYVKATAEYGVEFPAYVRNENVFGMQFHPEKSGDVGIEMIRRFGALQL